MVEKFPLNIPMELHELTEQCIKAQASYGQFMHQLTQAITSGAPSNLTAAGFKEVQERAMTFAKENAESSFALARELADAKDPQELLSIQNRYAQTQIQTYARQVQELSRMTGEAIAGIARKI